MRQLRRMEKLIEELLRPYAAVITHRPAQARAVEGRRALLHTIEHFAFGFRQTVKIVDQIDQHELPAERFREMRFDPERKLASAQLKIPMPFVIVDHRLVVKLGRADKQRRVSTAFSTRRVSSRLSI